MIRIMAVLFLLLPGPATALSCVFPDLATTYKELAAAPQSYVIVYGRYGANPARLSQSRHADILRYKFSGNLIGPNGIGAAFNQPVVVTRSKPRPQFADPGGSIATDRAVLLFFEKLGGKYLMDASICGFRQFYDPSNQDLRKVSRCMKGLSCRPSRN